MVIVAKYVSVIAVPFQTPVAMVPTAVIWVWDASTLMLPAALSVRPVPPATHTVPAASGKVMVRSAVGSVTVSVVS